MRTARLKEINPALGRAAHASSSRHLKPYRNIHPREAYGTDCVLPQDNEN
jgi:hypothetical protein